MLKAGTLNRTVDLLGQIGTGTLDDPIHWGVVASVAANIRMLNGKEVLLADTDVGIASASIRIRYRTDVTTGWKVQIGNAVFDVKAALPNIAGRDYTDLVCTISTA
ncbi:phage head closure protein [Paraburkholderia sp. USG1]|uniref:phage head closure protein n=1 Tax=Paraburkholderia sp. USG1 TaxID=2952268 RepID=UPI0028662CDB|nr:phage head closure protein [Paraburkholderia sp. USG1]MDR8396993.1 phage head closure protein [Paraburkholderia sp. USG1]